MNLREFTRVPRWFGWADSLAAAREPALVARVWGGSPNRLLSGDLRLLQQPGCRQLPEPPNPTGTLLIVQ